MKSLQRRPFRPGKTNVNAFHPRRVALFGIDNGSSLCYHLPVKVITEAEAEPTYAADDFSATTPHGQCNFDTTVAVKATYRAVNKFLSKAHAHLQTRRPWLVCPSTGYATMRFKRALNRQRRHG